jgi:hypothetical protein
MARTAIFTRLEYNSPSDLPAMKAVKKKEDGPVKRILKLLGGVC